MGIRTDCRLAYYCRFHSSCSWLRGDSLDDVCKWLREPWLNHVPNMRREKNSIKAIGKDDYETDGQKYWP